MTPNSEPPQPSRRAFNLSYGIITAALVIGAIALGYWLGLRQTAAPEKESAAAGFARDMMTHHAQAVDMATLIRDRSDDPVIRQLALDIILTQQAQIGQMQGWLTIWNLPLASTGPAMAWMGMPTTGPMPGMATPGQLNQLRGLTGRDAEVLFLTLMIAHHRAGVAMANAALDRVARPEVRVLAQSIVVAQESEIALMQDLLEQKDASLAPTPEMPGMSHATATP